MRYLFTNRRFYAIIKANEWVSPLIIYGEKVTGMASNFLSRMAEAALPIIESCDCELVDAEFKKEGGQSILRFYCERKEGSITLDDCVEISTLLSDKFDEIDSGQGSSYVLEVSSPGVERPLKKPADYIKFTGREIDVSLYEAVMGKKKFSCILAGYDEQAQELALGIGDVQAKIKLSNVAKINLHFSFE
jgi:ribosome maturation factor RimP